LAAVAFCYVVREYAPCVVILLQVADIHSLVLICGSEDWPWVIDMWTSPPTIVSLKSLPRGRIDDHKLRLHYGFIDMRDDLMARWTEMFKGVPDPLDTGQEPGPRENQTRAPGAGRSRSS
jgi:hypothetical protein